MKNLNRFLCAFLAALLCFNIFVESALAADVPESEKFSAYVPTSLEITMDKNGVVHVPTGDAAKIFNDAKTKDICVTAISVTMKNGWTPANWSSDFAAMAKNTKSFGLRMRGDTMQADGTFSINPDSWIIKSNSFIDLGIEAQLPAQTTAHKEVIGTIAFTLDWANNSSSADDGKHTISFIPGEHGSIDDTTPVKTDENGIITQLPNVIPDAGYEFDHWEDASGNTVKIGNKLDADTTLKPVFVEDESYKEDESHIIDFVPGEHGTINDDIPVKTDENGIIQELPSVTPDEGYKFDHWEDQNGNPVESGDKLDSDITLKPVFAEDESYKEDESHTIDFVPGEHGTINDDTPITTDKNGIIQELPSVTPDEGYEFDHWEDADGNIVNEGTVFQGPTSIKPVFTEIPKGTITADWTNGILLVGGTKQGQFSYTTASDADAFADVTSSDESISTVELVPAADGSTGVQMVNVTAQAVGTATITGSLVSGETASFTVDVSKIDQANVTAAMNSGKKPSVGETLSKDDITVTVPVVDSTGMTTNKEIDPDKVEVPDGVLSEGDNTVSATVTIDGVEYVVTVHITVSQGSDSPVLTVPEAKAAGYSFASYEDGLEITGFENVNFSSKIDVPKQIGDFEVLRIGDNVFADQSNLKEINLPDTIVSIGSNAFKGCVGISDVNVSNVATMDYTTFEGCTGMQSVNLVSYYPDFGKVGLDTLYFASGMSLDRVTGDIVQPERNCHFLEWRDDTDSPYDTADLLTDGSTLQAVCDPTYGDWKYFKYEGDTITGLTSDGFIHYRDNYRLVIPRVSPEGVTIRNIAADAFNEKWIKTTYLIILYTR